MRSVLRRLLWLGPTVVLITLVTFGALSVTLPAASELADLPLFFNPAPGAIERLATQALQEISSRPDPDADSERNLSRLGGAALPFVLPALDSLSPDGRARVVKALRPVGARMGFEIDESWDARREVAFWTRFWEEHSIDYRPLVARRAVLRLIQRSTTLRDAEVRQLDTYALDELILQMGVVRVEADVDRVRRLADLCADMTGELELRLGGEADIGAAGRVASAWTDWWSRHRTRYKTYSGTERVTAMLRDTRYGGWVVQAVRRKLGLLESGRSAWEVLREGSVVTLPLLGCGVLGALGNAILGGAISVVPRWRWLLRALGVLRAALPIAVLAVLLPLSAGEAARRPWVGGLLMLLGGAPLWSLQGGASAYRESNDFIRTLKSLGVPRWQIAVTTLRLSTVSIAVQLGAHMSSLLTLTFVVEYALGLPGLGTRTIEALRDPDLNWLMAITISTALFVGVLQVVSDVLVNVLDPRWQEASKRLGGSA